MERVAVGDLQAARVDLALAQRLDDLVGEVPPDDAHELDLREEGRRERYVGRRPADDAEMGPEGVVNGVEGDRADDEQG